jgi:uncharacterized protein YecE (DUF72 family)
VARLRVGTCSWKFPSWQGLVYSAPRDINYLQEYARRYDTVEVDQWFWSLFGEDSISLPRLADVEEYRNSVPEGFVFTAKVPNSVTLTHFYKKKKSGPLVPNPHFLSPAVFGAFLSALEALHDVLGPLMFQFEYLNKQKMTSQAHFQDLLAAFVPQIPAGFTYGVELRNGRWLNESHFRFLLEQGLIPVFLQGYWMPGVVEVYDSHRELVLQQKAVVIRLHGPDRKAMEEQTGGRWDRVVAPRDDELAAVADMVEDLVGSGVDVTLNVNNHYEGSAPGTIERIRALLKKAAAV